MDVPRSREFAVCRLVVCLFTACTCLSPARPVSLLPVACHRLFTLAVSQLAACHLSVRELDAFHVAVYRLAAYNLPAYACNLVA